MHELPLEGLRILVVEDEALIALDLEHLCREAGAADVVLRPGPAAFSATADAGVDVVVLDLVLAGASTLDLAAQLHAGDVPFVFATAYADVEGIAERFPGVALVEKPYDGAAVVGAIATAARRRRGPIPR